MRDYYCDAVWAVAASSIIQPTQRLELTINEEIHSEWTSFDSKSIALSDRTRAEEWIEFLNCGTALFSIRLVQSHRRDDIMGAMFKWNSQLAEAILDLVERDQILSMSSDPVLSRISESRTI